MNKIRGEFNIDRSKYVKLMSINLPVLRAKLSLSQTELADLIGVTRQTISSAESGARDLSWTNFVSLMFIFTQSEMTFPLLETLGIYTQELAESFRVINLRKLGNLALNAQEKGEDST